MIDNLNKQELDECPFCSPLKYRKPSSGKSWLGPNGENMHLETRDDDHSVYISCREAGWKPKAVKDSYGITYCPICGRNLIRSLSITSIGEAFAKYICICRRGGLDD